MFDIGLGEFVLIFLVFLLLFGPKSLPDLANKLGKAMNKVKKAQAEFQSQVSAIQNEINSAVEIDKENIKIKRPSDIKDPFSIKKTIGGAIDNAINPDTKKQSQNIKNTKPAEKVDNKENHKSESDEKL
ncbi:MAG: Sec-independent protein translocase protein TatB [Candidatus Kapaibacteriales bacterium]